MSEHKLNIGRYQYKVEREGESKKELYDDSSDEEIDWMWKIRSCYNAINSFILQNRCHNIVKFLYFFLIKIVPLLNENAIDNEK